MVNPLLIASATIGSIYSVGKAIDNERYWRDYAKNTGKVAKYPWMAGRYDSFRYATSIGYMNSFPTMETYGFAKKRGFDPSYL